MKANQEGKERVGKGRITSTRIQTLLKAIVIIKEYIFTKGE